MKMWSRKRPRPDTSSTQIEKKFKQYHKDEEILEQDGNKENITPMDVIAEVGTQEPESSYQGPGHHWFARVSTFFCNKAQFHIICCNV